jgi:hypothetical protein
MNKRYLPILALIALVLGACNQDKKANNKTVEKALEVELDTTSKVIRFENSLFSLPSPYQLSILVKQIGTDYNSELLNPAENFKQYTSLFKKSINLGIYGADLAYLNIYQQSPSAVTYFSIIKMLADELGLSAAFSPTIFNRIEKNVDNKDSLLYIMSNTYRDVDFFLKENQRQREGALVLAGGFIEAMHILTKLAIETKSPELIKRVGENKQPIENMIKILSPYYNESEDVAKLVDDLIDLAHDFDAIEVIYEYKEPTTIAEQKLTKVHSVSEIKIADDVLNTIDAKVGNIRSLLIN